MKWRNDVSRDEAQQVISNPIGGRVNTRNFLLRRRQRRQRRQRRRRRWRRQFNKSCLGYR